MTVDNAQVTNNDHPIASQYTPEQSQALSAFQSFARQAQSRTFDPADASRLIYFAALDGTGSDRRNSSVPETNVSRIEQAVKNELSAYGGGATLYLKGPATKTDLIPSLVDKITDFTVKATAREAYNAFADYVRNNPGKPVTLSGIGFSRGSATLSALKNMAYNEGVPDWRVW